MSPDQPFQPDFAVVQAPRAPWGKGFWKAIGNLVNTLWRPLSLAGPVPAERRETADFPSLNAPGNRSFGSRVLSPEASAMACPTAIPVAGHSTITPTARLAAGLHPNSSTFDGNPIPRPYFSPPARQSLGRPQPQPPRQPVDPRKRRFFRSQPQPSPQSQRQPLRTVVEVA